MPYFPRLVEVPERVRVRIKAPKPNPPRMPTVALPQPSYLKALLIAVKVGLVALGGKLRKLGDAIDREAGRIPPIPPPFPLPGPRRGFDFPR